MFKESESTVVRKLMSSEEILEFCPWLWFHTQIWAPGICCQFSSLHRLTLPVLQYELKGFESAEISVLVHTECRGIKSVCWPRGADAEEKFPLLDWPVEHLSVMQQTFSSRLFTVYVEPPSHEALRQRLADGRDPNEERFYVALSELEVVTSGTYNNLIDYRVVSREGEAASVADTIHASYLQAMGL